MILFHRLLPETVAAILSDSLIRERVLSQCDASEVLRDAFAKTEDCMNHYYEVSAPPFYSFCLFILCNDYFELKGMSCTSIYILSVCNSIKYIEEVDVLISMLSTYSVGLLGNLTSVTY